MLAFYFAFDAIAVLNELYTEREPAAGLADVQHVLRCFDNMNNPVPTWYLKDL